MHIYSLGLFFLKNQHPPPTQHFLKINTYVHFIISDLKISSIHNQPLLKENNNARCFSKTRINNHFIVKLCHLDIKSKKNPSGSFSCYKQSICILSCDCCLYIQITHVLVSSQTVSSLLYKLEKIYDFVKALKT